MNNRTLFIAAFAGGFMIGKNWSKIRRAIGPYSGALEGMTAKGYDSALRFMAEQMERFEDGMAAVKVRTPRARVAPRKKQGRGRSARRRAPIRKARSSSVKEAAASVPAAASTARSRIVIQNGLKAHA